MKTSEFTEDIDMIVESYINGNLSWVKEELKRDPSKIAQVVAKLKETQDDNAFINWVMMW